MNDHVGMVKLYPFITSETTIMQGKDRLLVRKAIWLERVHRSYCYGKLCQCLIVLSPFLFVLSHTGVTMKTALSGRCFLFLPYSSLH